MKPSRLRLVVTAALVGLVALVVAAQAVVGKESSDKPVAMDGQTREAVERANEERASRNTPAAREARVQSRTKFRGLSGERARDVAIAEFRALMTAPSFKGPRLREGERIKEYVGDRAAVVDTGDKNLLVESSLPLRVKDSNGTKAPVDMGLTERGGRLSPRNGLSEMSISRRASEGAKLERSGIAASFAGADGSAEAATVVQDKLFYPNVDTDTDWLVQPVPGGVETFTQLRSEDSPETHVLDLDLPAGASLRRVKRELGMPGGLEIVRDGEVLGAVGEPVALDAAQQEVPVSFAVHGDQVKITAAHRGGDWQYPIMVDPTITESWIYWYSNQWMDMIGWSPNANSGGWAFQNQTGYVGKWGLHVWGGPSFHYIYDRGEYIWRPPSGTSFIARADFHYIDHRWGQDCAEFGIWRENVGWSGSAAQQHCDNSWSGAAAYVSTCVAGGCPETGHPGAYGTLRVMTPQTGNIGGYPYLYVGGATMSLGDSEPPSIDINQVVDYRVGDPASGRPSTWRQQEERVVKASGSDPGLGIKQWHLIYPLQTGGTKNVPKDNNCGDRTRRCVIGAQSGIPNDQHMPWTYHTDELPEGDNQVGVLAYDPTYKYSGFNWNVKVDRTTPAMDLPTAIQDHDGGWVPRRTIGFTTTARDGTAGATGQAARAGVRRLELKVDGVVTDGPEQACPNNNCSLTDELTVNLGGYTNGQTATGEVRSWDHAGNVTAPWVFTMKVDDRKPTIASSGTMKPGPGKFLGNGTYNLHVTARDGDSTNPSSGARIEELFVDNVRVNRFEAACTTSNCVHDRDFQINTANYTEGAHTVRVRVEDEAGNFEEESWTIEIDRTAPVLTATGPLRDAGPGYMSELTYGLTQSATDGSTSLRRSGVERLEVWVDDSLEDSFGQACVLGSCSLSDTYTFTPAMWEGGSNTITVVAIDGAGNRSEVTWDVNDQDPPPPPAAAPCPTTPAETVQNPGVPNIEGKVAHWRLGETSGTQAADSASQPELVTNGGFETDTSGWTTEAGSFLAGSATLTRQTGSAPDGASAGKVVTSATQSAGIGTDMKLTAGRKYNVRLKLKRELGGSELRIALGERVTPHEELVIHPGATPGADGYTEYTGTVTPARSSTYRLYVRVANYPGAATTFYVDSASVKAQGSPGTYTGGYTLGQPGLAPDGDKAVRLDGVNGHVTVPPASFEHARNGSFSVELWYTPPNPTALVPLFSADTGNGTLRGDFYLFATATGQVQVGYFNEDVYTAAGVLTAGTKAHIVATYDAATDTTKIYVNGVEKSSSNLGPITGTAPMSPKIGGWVATPWWGDYYGSGVYDEVALYDRALSASTIQDLHAPPAAQATSAQAVSAVQANEPGLVAASVSGTDDGAPLDPTLEAPADPGNPTVDESPAPLGTEMTLDEKNTIPQGEVAQRPEAGFVVGNSSEAQCIKPSTSPVMATDATLVAGDSAVFANTAPGVDTIVRPAAQGTNVYDQIRTPAAPEKYEWKVGLSEGEKLQVLSNGAVAIVSPANEMTKDPNPPAPPPAGSTDPTKAGDTQTQLDNAAHNLAVAKAEVAGTVEAVIFRPWARDAAGNPVDAYFTVEGTTLALHVDLDDADEFPVYTLRAAAQKYDCYGDPRRDRGADRSVAYPFPYPRKRTWETVLEEPERATATNLPDCRIGSNRKIKDRPQTSRGAFNADGILKFTTLAPTAASGYNSTMGWPLKDSMGDILGYLKRPGVTTGPWTLTDEFGTVIGTTKEGTTSTTRTRILGQGRACMKTNTLEANHVLVTFAPTNSEGFKDGQPLYMKTRGFLHRDALTLGGRARWDATIDKYDIGCGEDQHGYTKSPIDPDNPTPVTSPNFDARDRYLGERSYVEKFDKSTSPWRVIEKKDCKRTFPQVCGPYINYQGAVGLGTVVVTNATTGVAGGGVARAIFQAGGNTRWHVLDEFAYQDPNVPCFVDNPGRKHFYKRVGKWAYVHMATAPGENKITGWVPRPRQDGPRRTGGSLCNLAETQGIDLPLNYWAGWN